MRGSLVAWVGPLLLAVAGCTSGESSGAPPVTSATIAPPAEANGTLASLSGVVVDEESTPIRAADVALAETPFAGKTDAAGRFTFNGVEPGKAVLIVQALGFEPLSRQVDLKAGEVTETHVVLRAIEIVDEPYAVSIPRTGHIVFGNAALTTIWYQGVNHSAYNSLVCDPCRFTLNIDVNPADVLAEATWTGGVGLPNVNAEVFVNYLAKGPDANYTEPHWLYYGYLKDRGAAHWNEDHLKRARNMDQVRLWLRPDLDGLSVDHRVTVWTTFGYNGPLPEGFSALPPP